MIFSRAHSFSNFEMLDALNKIIQNSHFQKEVSLEEQKAQKEDQFLRAKQFAYMIYDHFRVTGVLDYCDLFLIIRRNDNVQEFDTRWDEIILSMTKIPLDVKSLYMQEDSRQSPDRRQSDMEFTRTNRMEKDPSRWRDAHQLLVLVDILYFVDPVLWKEETWGAKENAKRR